MPIDFTGVGYLTFDCYGTLIDWERGIADALRPILVRHDRDVEDRILLESYGAFEAEIESGEYIPYREVLKRVVDRFGERFGFRPSADDRDRFARSVGDWPAFPDSRVSLARLAERFRLVVLSNVDDDLFAGSNKKLGSPFHKVLTAQQIGSYKPALRNFRFAIQELGGDTRRIVHVAQSLYHDIKPAREAGLRTVWINRRANQPGTGATPPSDAEPDYEFATLDSLADALDRH